MAKPPNGSPEAEQQSSLRKDAGDIEPAPSVRGSAGEAEQGSSSQEDGRFHTYTTHRIPWWVRAMWVCFWIGAIWYVIKYVIPMTRNYF